jgi:translation initiation factor 1
MFPISKESKSLYMEQQKKFRSFSELEQLKYPLLVDLPPSINQHDGKGAAVRVLLDMHGRKGKSVTIVSGLQHNPTIMEEIARILKQYCGAGGTVKEGKIEIQGNQLARVAEKLTQMHYIVK